MVYKSFLQVLGCGGIGGAATPSVVLFLDNARYVFGCGEGTQRLCAEAKTRLSRVNTIFLTKLTWEGIGGLPGSLLTQLVDERRAFDVVTPPGGTAVMATFAGVLGKGGALYRVWECGGPESPQRFEDGIIRVDTIALVPGKEEQESDAEMECLKEIGKKKQRLVQDRGNGMSNGQIIGCGVCYASVKPVADGKCNELLYKVTPKASAAEDPFTVGAEDSESVSLSIDEEGCYLYRTLEDILQLRKNSCGDDGNGRPSSLCYVCHMPDAPGKFDAKRAAALGVPSGPIRSRIVRGETVTLPDGRVVQPSDCMGPTQLGSIFAVIDCPTDDHVNALSLSSRFDRYFSTGDLSRLVKCVIHFTPRSVVCGKYRDEYLKWCSRFSPEAIHMMIGKGYPSHGMLLKTSTVVRDKLHTVDGVVFPLTPIPEIIECPELSAIPNSMIGTNRCMFSLSGKIGFSDPPFVTEEEIEAEKHAATIKAFPPLKVESVDKFAVTFLGTGSSAPSKQRNVSAVLLRTEYDESVLIDCGENTFGQLCDHFGPTAAKELVVHHLCAIVFTHLHADHHLGLLRILAIRNEASKTCTLPPLHIVCTDTLSQFYCLFCTVACCSTLVSKSVAVFHTLKDFEGSYSPLSDTKMMMKAVPVEHCYDSHALIIAEDDWRIAISGDCRPSDVFAAERPIPDLLIHEATFADGMESDAIMKKHSTVSEAISVARRMEARFLLLTHFSQRYSHLFPTLPEAYLTPSVSTMNPPLMCAFDHMTVTSRTLPVLPSYISILQSLFAEESSSTSEEAD